MRIKFHPLFFLLALVLVALGQAVAFVSSFVAVLLHELAHAYVAKGRGYVLKEIVLLPFGAVLFGEEQIERSSSVAIALAGPLMNFVLALFTIAFWWLFPELSSYTKAFLYANLTIGTFNLLPVFPLDGSRVVLGFCKNKARALKGLKIAGIVLSFVAFGLFIASAFFDINFTLGIIAIFLFVGATFGTDKESYLHVADCAFKNYYNGVEKRTVLLSEESNLYRALQKIKSDYETEFIVLNNDGEEETRLSEKEMKKLFEQNKMSSSLKACIKGKAKNRQNETADSLKACIKCKAKNDQNSTATRSIIDC